jgi:DNA polymerase III alpha subunit (gram-positive type)
LSWRLKCAKEAISFQKVDLYRSSASEFIIDGNSLIPPFNSIPGLGTNAALNIVKAREEGEFLSKEDLQKRGKCQKRSWNTWIATAVSSHFQIRTSCHYSRNCLLKAGSFFICFTA